MQSLTNIVMKAFKRQTGHDCMCLYILCLYPNNGDNYFNPVETVIIQFQVRSEPLHLLSALFISLWALLHVASWILFSFDLFFFLQRSYKPAPNQCPNFNTNAVFNSAIAPQYREILTTTIHQRSGHCSGCYGNSVFNCKLNWTEASRYSHRCRLCRSLSQWCWMKPLASTSMMT